jgi:hypothetical protein
MHHDAFRHQMAALLGVSVAEYDAMVASFGREAAIRSVTDERLVAAYCAGQWPTNLSYLDNMRSALVRRAEDADRQDLYDTVTDEQLEEAYGFVPEDESWRDSMKNVLLDLPSRATGICPDCGGSGDSFRSPAGIVRCRTCGGSGWS